LAPRSGIAAGTVSDSRPARRPRHGPGLPAFTPYSETWTRRWRGSNGPPTRGFHARLSSRSIRISRTSDTSPRLGDSSPTSKRRARQSGFSGYRSVARILCEEERPTVSFSSSATASSPARSTAYWVPSLTTGSTTGHTSAHRRRGSSKGRAPYRAALCRVYSCECLQHLSAAPARRCCKPRVERPFAADTARCRQSSCGILQPSARPAAQSDSLHGVRRMHRAVRLARAAAGP
jgi:hypothetical protein